jgi:hypothetical protein
MTRLRRLTVFLVVVGLLAVAGDRVAAKLATIEAQQRLVAAGLTSPQVDVGGFPFLTQLLARRFDDVRVTTTSLRIGTGHAGQVAATARDVEVPSGSVAKVGQLTAHGTIAYAEVLRSAGQSGLRLSRAGSGQVQLRRQVSVLGRTYAVVALGRVEPRGNRVVVTPTSVRLASGGAVDAQLSGLIADRLALSYRVRGLPKGVAIDRITAGTEGFVVTVSGRDVRLAT